MIQLKMNNWLEYNTEENLDGLAVLFKYNSSHYIFYGYGEVLLFAASNVLPVRSG